MTTCVLSHTNPANWKTLCQCMLRLSVLNSELYKKECARNDRKTANMCCSVAQLNCDITVTEWSEKRRPYSEEIHHKGRVRSLQFHTRLTVDSVLQLSYSSQQFPAPFLLRCFHTVFILSHFSWVR